MAKKATGSKSSHNRTASSSSKANSSGVGGTKSAAAPTTATTPARRPAPAAPTSSFSSNPQLYISLFFLLVPLVQMLWTPEAPKRPFSLLRDPTTGIPLDDKLIEPKILLVTAHPDDEVLLAPTVLSLLDEEHRKTSMLYALCLSTGDLYGGKELGEKRTQEWKESWDVLGLSEERRFILDVPELKDSNTTWDAGVIADQISSFVLKYDIDTILTFDEQGITGHPNHISLPTGIKALFASPSFTAELAKSTGRIVSPRLFTLKTHPLTRHYGPLTPIVEHLLLAARALMLDPEKTKEPGFVLPTVFLSDVKRYGTTWKALLAHRSQMGPKELLLAAWGRYLWINEWAPV